MQATTMTLLDLDLNLVSHAKCLLTVWSHEYAHLHFTECGTRPREVQGHTAGHTGHTQVTQQAGLEAYLPGASLLSHTTTLGPLYGGTRPESG